MRKLPKLKKWPKGLPKPGSAKLERLKKRKAENDKRSKAIESVRKALGKI